MEQHKSLSEVYMDFVFPLGEETPEVVQEMSKRGFFDSMTLLTMITEYKYGGRKGYIPDLRSYTGDKTTDISGVYDFKGNPRTVSSFFGSEENFEKARSTARLVYCDPYALDGTDFEEQWKKDCGWYKELEKYGFGRDEKRKGGGTDVKSEG